MDATTAANVIRWYQSLEEQLQEVLTVVPPQGTNLQTAWSPKLATVLVEACNLIESVLYDLLDSSPHYDTTTKKVQVPGEKKPRPRDRLELHHYARLYCSSLRLNTCRALFFHEPLKWQTPFGVWLLPDDFPQPTWWAVHNASKHRRLRHFADFTLEKAIAALAGALVVIASAPTIPVAMELVWAMIRHEWINPAKPYTASEIEGFYAGQFLANHFLCVETSLFAVLFGHEPLSDQLDELWKHGFFLFMGGDKLTTWTWREPY